MEEISHFQAKGSVLVCGDLNERTGVDPDTISTQGDKYISISIIIYSKLEKRSRQTKFRCQSPQASNSPLGSRTVDYAITDIDQDHLRAFIVSSLTPLSDHNKKAIYLKRTEFNKTISGPTQLPSIEYS